MHCLQVAFAGIWFGVSAMAIANSNGGARDANAAFYDQSRDLIKARQKHNQRVAAEYRLAAREVAENTVTVTVTVTSYPSYCFPVTEIITQGTFIPIVPDTTPTVVTVSIPAALEIPIIPALVTPSPTTAGASGSTLSPIPARPVPLPPILANASVTASPVSVLSTFHILVNATAKPNLSNATVSSTPIHSVGTNDTIKTSPVVSETSGTVAVGGEINPPPPTRTGGGPQSKVANRLLIAVSLALLLQAGFMC